MRLDHYRPLGDDDYKPEECPDCKGSGVAGYSGWGWAVPCPTCKGSGNKPEKEEDK